MTQESIKTAEELACAMHRAENPEQRKILTSFFKTAKGQYGAGDEFLGLKVPETRAFVKEAKDLPLNEVEKLLDSKWHEVRLCGFLVLVDRYNRQWISDIEKSDILQLYLTKAHCANNWDLVDLSCYKIIGKWLVESSAPMEEKVRLMDGLADSDNLWKKRISMVSTMATLKNGNSWWTLRYALRHLHHTHDLMHKATGWMLREMGKRCGMSELRNFLEAYVKTMPRTTLRYAIEKMDYEERRYWMQK